MKFRIALAQINSIVGDFEGNSRKVIELLKKARELKADLLAFPELSLCGYPPEDLVFRTEFVKENLRALKKVISFTKNISLVIGLLHYDRAHTYNAAAFIHNRKLVDIYHKIFLPNYSVFDEKRYFQPGATCSVYQIGDINIGVNICEDIWYQDGPSRVQTGDGNTSLIINISASPYYVQKLNERQRMLSTRARENNTYVAYVNLVGGQDELVFDGGSMVIDPSGRLIARAREFAEDFLAVDIDLQPSRISSGKKPQQVTNELSHQGRCWLKTFRLKPARPGRSKPAVKSLINKKMSLFDEIYSALVLGTRDYLHKNGFQKGVLGLSGGIDSALVAAIAVDALGKDNVTAITMPSRYSSLETQQDSETIARNLGIELLKIPIDDIFQAYLSQLKEHFIGRPEDITEENLQARIRGNLLMAISNKFGRLVLGTGNKSEMSVGYCTLYGDMASGFAIIKDVPKILVSKLVKYYNQKSGRPIIPPSVIKRSPSAELKPNQKDEDSIPPYAMLDPVLKAYIENNKTVAEIVKMGYNNKTVRKVVSLVNGSEYKRRQAPPGVKITRLAFGRDRRIPITNKFQQ